MRTARPNRTRTARGLALGGAAAAALAVGLVGATTANAAGSAVVLDGVLIVVGSDAADRIALRLAADPAFLEVDLGDDGTAEAVVDRALFDRIDVAMLNGADAFRVDQSRGAFADEALTVDGGAGDDRLDGGDGVEHFIGGNGRDAVDGNRGDDSAQLGTGGDSFRWDPGDGSDLVEGGSGDDVLDFNGAGANETMQLVPEGERAVFLRDVANIRMDMDGVERLDLSALGGADRVTVADMTGTDMRKALIDLTLAGGDDGQTDIVTVQGTPAADAVEVDDRAGRIDVKGLQVTTQITGAQPADQLVVRTEGGADSVLTDPAVEALVDLTIDLGAGQP